MRVPGITPSTDEQIISSLPERRLLTAIDFLEVMAKYSQTDNPAIIELGERAGVILP